MIVERLMVTGPLVTLRLAAGLDLGKSSFAIKFVKPFQMYHYVCYTVMVNSSQG